MPKFLRRVILAGCTSALLLSSHAAVLAQQNAGADESFTVVLLPDTQFYSESYPDTYVRQTQWIRDRAEQDNIKFVIHLGDIVQTSTKQSEWEVASRAMRLLDDAVPYSVVPGNHDMDIETRSSASYNEHFSPARFAGRAWYGGQMGESNDNNFCFFEASGMKFMVVSLEFAPRDEALEWAAGVTRRYPDHRVIVATHCYLGTTGRNTTCATTSPDAGNSGEQIWQKFVRRQPNIFLVVSGHVAGVALQASTNDSGGKVIEMLTDYQALPNGGNGWLRSLQFVPGENKIYVKAYSPLLDVTNDDPRHSFSLGFEMTGVRSKAE